MHATNSHRANAPDAVFAFSSLSIHCSSPQRKSGLAPTHRSTPPERTRYGKGQLRLLLQNTTLWVRIQTRPGCHVGWLLGVRIGGRMSSKKRFKATLERLRGNLGWTIVRLPFDATKAWPERNRMRVKGSINGFAFRTSLFGLKEGGQLLLVNKQMQRHAHVTLGSAEEIVLEPDLEERATSLPP